MPAGANFRSRVDVKTDPRDRRKLSLRKSGRINHSWRRERSNWRMDGVYTERGSPFRYGNLSVIYEGNLRRSGKKFTRVTGWDRIKKKKKKPHLQTTENLKVRDGEETKHFFFYFSQSHNSLLPNYIVSRHRLFPRVTTEGIPNEMLRLCVFFVFFFLEETTIRSQR